MRYVKKLLGFFICLLLDMNTYNAQRLFNNFIKNNIKIFEVKAIRWNRTISIASPFLLKVRTNKYRLISNGRSREMSLISQEKKTSLVPLREHSTDCLFDCPNYINKSFRRRPVFDKKFARGGGTFV